jgi:hypothetical protein
VDFLGDGEGFAGEGVDVVDLGGGGKGAEDVGALFGVVRVNCGSNVVGDCLRLGRWIRRARRMPCWMLDVGCVLWNWS